MNNLPLITRKYNYIDKSTLHIINDPYVYDTKLISAGFMKGIYG